MGGQWLIAPICLLLAIPAGCRQDAPPQAPDPEVGPASAPPLLHPPAATQPAAAEPLAPATESQPPGWSPSADAREARFLGLVAPKPPTWIEHPPTSSMRLTQFTVPGREGQDAAHVVVFYFGPGSGGGIEENIARWEAQFRPEADGTPQQAVIERFEADGMPVTLVELVGDWMRMGARWYTPDQLFLAAIVQAPRGNLFIRFAGDHATVEANRGDFLTMIEGLRRQDQPAP